MEQQYITKFDKLGRPYEVAVPEASIEEQFLQELEEMGVSLPRAFTWFNGSDTLTITSTVTQT